MNSSRIDRVLQVLSLVALAPEPTPLKEIGARLGLHPSMVSRIVADLIAGGLLAKVTYRTVTGTPALAALGRSAGKNHPLTGIAREVLHKPMAEREKLSCEFATVVPGGFFHFYKVNRKVSAPELLWRSDLAAVIFASMPPVPLSVPAPSAKERISSMFSLPILTMNLLIAASVQVSS